MQKSMLTKVGLATGGLVAGVVLAGAMTAQAAPSPSPAAGGRTAATTEDPHPGDNGADGVPEAQEHHGGRHGHGLDLSGTVTAVGSKSVTIKTASGTTEYAVTGASDIDKNGEAALNDLAVGDAVTFSAEGTTTKTIDKLHAGDETKNMPVRDGAAPVGSGPSASPDA